MKRLVGLVLGVSVLATLAFVAAVPLTASSSSRALLAFNAFDGVSGAFLGSSNPVRGIRGGGLPWVLSEAHARLLANGEFEVEVEGLVIDPANATAQARGIAGTNPIPFFFATLSCEDNTTAVTNVNTTPVPASSSGDAVIDQTISLPGACFAPIVLVRGSPTGAPSGPWFAISGF